MSSEFGIGLMFSFSVISDALNATMSSPAWIFPATPSPPLTTNAPESLSAEAWVAEITTLLFVDVNCKIPLVVSIVVPLVSPSVILFARTIPIILNWL